MKWNKWYYIYLAMAFVCFITGIITLIGFSKYADLGDVYGISFLLMWALSILFANLAEKIRQDEIGRMLNER